MAAEGNVARIGDVEYKTLNEAIENVQVGDTIELIDDVHDATGISVPSGSNFTIDFHEHEYVLTGPGAGSTNTETNGFQLLKDSTLVFKNGTIRIAEGAKNIKRIIQSYADVTFENMEFYSKNQVGGENYALSFNAGSVLFSGSTKIISSSADVISFDVCYWASGGYTEGVNVSFDKTFTGSVNGAIVYDSTDRSKANLTINGSGAFGAIVSTSASVEDPNITISGGSFSSVGTPPSGMKQISVENHVVSGMKVDENGTVVINEETAVAKVIATGAAYASLQEAIEAAPSQSGVEILKDPGLEDTVTISKPIALHSSDGVEISALVGEPTFVLSGECQLFGLSFNLDQNEGDTGTNIVSVTGKNCIISGCTFEGNYEDGSDLVSRGIEVSGSAEGIKIENNSFLGLRQPAYINDGAKGSVSGNYAEGTRGWVVCAASGIDFSGNTFKGNTNDICIINGQSSGVSENLYAEKTVDLSKGNNGAYVQNQVSKVEAKGGNLVVGKGGNDYTLEKALADAQNGDTVKLEDDISTASFSIPAGVTLDGDGHTITCSTRNDNGAFITASTGADNVTIKDVTIDVDGNMKHGVQFYCNEGGVLDGVTVKGSYWTAVQVNGAEGVTIDGCTLDPQAEVVDGATMNPYAFIEFSMGDGVESVPSMTVGDVDFGDADCPNVWVDDDTVGSIKKALELEGAEDSEVIGAIKERITNKSYSDLGISIELATGNPVVGEIGGVPVAPPVVTKPSYDVAVDQPANGAVELSAKTAKEGQKVTVTVTPDAGFELVSLVVADEDGDALELTENADGTYSFEMPAGDVTVHASFACDGGELCPSHGFADVDQEQWYHAAIDWAVDNDVLQGVGDGLMLPDGDITRAQMAQVLWNVEGQPAAAEGEGFSDVSEGDWFAGAVAWASQEGIFVGYDGAFDPDAELTREQAATVLMRWAESNGEDVSGRADLSGFPDADGISEWAVESVRWAVDAGVLEGVANPDGTTTVSAQGTATRAQTAALMMRLLEA